MTATRQQVVTEALTWIGTPYHPRGRIKGVGVDCAQLPAAVYEATGMIPHVEPEYPPDWHLHRDEDLYVQWVLRFAHEITEAEAGPGDLVLWLWGRAYSHGGILVDGHNVVHAYIGTRVSLDDINQHEELKVRARRFFSMWGA